MAVKAPGMNAETKGKGEGMAPGSVMEERSSKSSMSSLREEYHQPQASWLFEIPLVSMCSSLVAMMRTYLEGHVNLGTEQLLKLQRLRTPLLDKYFLLASLCGSEVFYTLLLPFIFWTISPELGRMIGSLLTLGIFTGNLLKNLFCLPRPPSPPVWTPTLDKETLDNRDFGWPSTHSLNAISLPFFALRFFLGFVWLWESENPLSLTFWYTLAFFWSGSIILSRMYLGVHSPADVSGGMIIGVIILRAFLSVCDSLNDWILTGANVTLTMHLASFALLLIHPQCHRTFTFAETTSILGWLTGILSGNNMSGLDSSVFASSPDLATADYWMLAIAIAKPLARFVLGLGITVPIYLASKKLLVLAIFGSGYKAPTPPRKTDFSFWETMVKFFSYSTIGWTTTYVAPLLFTQIGLW